MDESRCQPLGASPPRGRRNFQHNCKLSLIKINTSLVMFNTLVHNPRGMNFGIRILYNICHMK